MNPNHPDGGGMETHACRVWNNYVLKSGFDNLLVIAHSAGGGCLTAIQKNFSDTFYNHVKKIAYTDSWTIEKKSLTET